MRSAPRETWLRLCPCAEVPRYNCRRSVHTIPYHTIPSDLKPFEMAMSREHQDRLRRCHVKLVEDLDTTDVLDHLFAEEILTMDMKDTITAEQTRRKKASALLDILPRRGDQAYYVFCNALRNTGQEWLADLLEQ